MSLEEKGPCSKGDMGSGHNITQHCE